MNQIKMFFDRLEGWQKEQIKLYVIFIVCVSIACIFMAEFAKETNLSERIGAIFQKNVVNKGIENMVSGVSSLEKDTLLTMYRFQEFGSCDPNDIDVNAPMIALTFDDGPNPEDTERILKVLRDNYSHATFFVVGINAAKYPETLREIAASGCELGNHTGGHKSLTTLTDEEINSQIDEVNRYVKAATGEETTVIRPPYGAYDDRVLSLLSKPVILWDLDTLDWDSRDAAAIVDRLLNNVKDGDIVLMHDIYESTAEAVEYAVPKLKEKGFLIVSVSELAQYKGKPLELHKTCSEILKEQAQK